MAASAEWLDSLFEQHRQRHYTRELLFSTEVDLMALVALGLRPSLHAAAQSSEGLKVSMQALYEKVHHTEPRVVRELVQSSEERLKLQQPSWASGYRVRVLDGNHLAASQKRLKPLRGLRGAALPGQALVVYAPEWDLVVDMVPAEDAHAQERALMGSVLERVQAGEWWLADRNFSTRRILFAVEDKHAAFVIREHGVSPSPTEVGPLKKVGRVETGVVFEQAVEIEDEQGQGQRLRLRLRLIELQLEEPTEDGETRIRVLTNVPPERLGAKEVVGVYRRRWSIEGMFGRLESVLKSEVKTLGYPRAALLAFGVAVMAYNVLAVMLAAVETEHRLKATEVSSYYVADEVKATYGGMMIAMPEPLWRGFESQTDEELGKELLRLASHVKCQALEVAQASPGPEEEGEEGVCVEARGGPACLDGAGATRRREDLTAWRETVATLTNGAKAKDCPDAGCRSVISGDEAPFTKPRHEKPAHGTQRTAGVGSRGARHAPGSGMLPTP